VYRAFAAALLLMSEGLSTGAHTILGLCSLLLAVSCRSEGGSATAQEREQAVFDAASGDEPDGRASWGPGVPEIVPAEALAAELARRSSLEMLSVADDADELRVRGLWSLARIGSVEAREQMLAELDGGESSALAAAALLEVPRSEPGSPPEPLDGPPEWAALEDALWTRYALTDPAALGQARALLLSIARVGGSRSIARLGVDLAEVPGPDHADEHRARWSAAMQALGILCARGWSLDQATLDALLEGLQQRAGDQAISSASLYAASRCVRSSGELLVESREQIVESLTAHVDNPSSSAHASLAWRTFAALGELPEVIPTEILGARPPAWEVEVEAVRALGTDLDGAELLRERLAASLDERALDALAGARVHVIVAALQAMRSVIDVAPPTADAQLLAIAEQLTAVRRSEDPRARKAAVLALCELRLLQAIRTGDTTALERCHVLAGAPAVELPISLLVNFEVEALLRATRDDAARNGKLRTVAIDDETVLADRVEDTAPDEPGRALRIARLLELARDPDAARATPALQALAEIDDPSVLPTLRVALLSEDPGILAAAATTIAVRSVDASKRDADAVELLEVLVEQRTEAGELEARLSAIDALGALARTAVASVDPNPAAPPTVDPEAPWLARTIVPLATDVHVAVRRHAREALLGHPQLLLAFDAAERNTDETRPSPFPEQVADALAEFFAKPVAGLRVTTSAGIFTIEFAGVASPINQANLAALARSGFYTGLGFHRVVPGFVVQGGDPRGDGYGGPGYVVPCEWSNLRYERGTVGIALAGKDTGGSQFFVTQTPQPHLDARYTVVGQIGEGLEVIDRLLPGDVIEAVEVVYLDPVDASKGANGAP
jgi:cyclophilin family peptidyl-prolyl cis-trans isomerase